MLYKLLFIPLLLLFPLLGYSQAKPVGKFQKSLLKIGEHIEYSLSIKYPSAENIIFPDSTYSFAPFEFVNKRYFKTVSDSLYSLDSVVYTLVAFEIDSIQHLSVPVFLIEEGDSTKLFPAPDSIAIYPSLTQIPDSVALMVNTNYVEVRKDFNYIYFLVGFAIIAFVTIVVVLLFGKKFVRYLKVRRLRKQHLKFLLSFKEYKNAITRENFEEQLQNAYTSWKKYMQQLTNMFFTSYSTKEIFVVVKDENLRDILKEIDRAIYANKFPEEPHQLLSELTRYAQNFFEEKIRNINNGTAK